VDCSNGDCTIEPDDSIRLGLRIVKNLSASGTEQLLREREAAPFASLHDFRRRARLNKDELRTLAEIGALNCFAEHRRDALWQVERPMRQADLFETASDETGESPLMPMDYARRVQADFIGMNLTTGKHPMALLRGQLPDVWRAADLPKGAHGTTLRIAGNVICRQRPGTAKGFVFVSLEDETGISNAIITPPLFEANRLLLTEEPYLIIEGRLQNVKNVIHIKAEKIERLRQEVLAGAKSYDFH
jgi:error-prone DNA polymerase